MTLTALRRFADVRLGDTVAGDAGDADLAWESRACRLVQNWAGARHARAVHVEVPSPARIPRDVAGRIYARHLDDSRCVTIEVIGRDRGQICASAVIRVALG
jgi:hypothetical protein